MKKLLSFVLLSIFVLGFSLQASHAMYHGRDQSKEDEDRPSKKRKLVPEEQKQQLLAVERLELCGGSYVSKQAQENLTLQQAFGQYGISGCRFVYNSQLWRISSDSRSVPKIVSPVDTCSCWTSRRLVCGKREFNNPFFDITSFAGEPLPPYRLLDHSVCALTTLNLSENSTVTDEDLWVLQDQDWFPHLQRLNLRKNGKITDNCLKYLTTLTDLNLEENVCITAASVQYLTNLEILDITNSNTVALERLPFFLTKLTTLLFSATRTDIGKSISFPSLKNLICLYELPHLDEVDGEVEDSMAYLIHALISFNEELRASPQFADLKWKAERRILVPKALGQSIFKIKAPEVFNLENALYTNEEVKRRIKMQRADDGEVLHNRIAKEIEEESRSVLKDLIDLSGLGLTFWSTAREGVDTYCYTNSAYYNKGHLIESLQGEMIQRPYWPYELYTNNQ